MRNSEIEQSGTVKGHLPNEASLSGRISNGLSLSGHISIGSGASDFIIKMTIEVNGDNYTVTSCDKTMEQIDAAVASGQNIKAIAFDKYVMPMTQMEYSESYTFGAFLGSLLIAANVAKNYESGTDDWQFYLSPITADIVNYSNAAIPRISTVSEALDKLVTNSHTHTNKLVIDKFTETDGKPTYDGETLGSDFIIKMMVTSDDNGKYTVTSCDATVEQIDSAVAAEKRVVLIATDTNNNLSWDIPIVQGFNGSNYYFATFLLGQTILSFVEKVGENKARWQFMVGQIGADFISYSNDALPNMSTVGEALDALVPKSHSHSNKAVLDKFAETDGKPTYNGEALGSGSGDFIIKMTVESNGSELIVTSCDTTIEQIDEAVVAEKRVVVVASIDSTILELPMVQGNKGNSYDFFAILSESVLLSSVYKIENTSDWSFGMIPIRDITAEDVSYTNTQLPNVENVKSALDDTIDTQQTQSADLESLRSGVSALIDAYETQGGDIASLKTQAHTHSNKVTLDLLSDANGKLQYNGSDISVTKNGVINALGYTPEAVSTQVTTGSNITLADNTEYRLTDVTTLNLSYPTGNFECWMRLSFAASGDVTVTLPAGTEYLGTTPDFKNGETWELSFKDGVLAAQKVGGDGCSSAPVKGIDYWTESDKAEIVADTLAALPTWTGGNY